ncbi:phospholipase D family protein [Dactylosporangium sp. NPDC051485]|uniref:phospholipase D family protein n=1 Tax=Dactylosporangium sp. NPDC051485 TaxID=3154846 RepID=UPI003417D3AB
MLAPDTRTLLLDALRPLPGSQLARAVALTFTLDLESLLVAPLAFAAHSLRESMDPVVIMESVRRCADRIDVFCQSGQVAVPPGESALLAFLEPMVHTVKKPRPGRLFHPKLWVLRFLDDVTGEVSLRLLVLSRNLTKDRSWDVCLRLDAVRGSRPTADNKPLADLLRHTLKLTVAPMPPSRLEAIETLIEDLRRAEWTAPDGVREVRFHPLGVPGNRPPTFEGARHLVISPFCTEDGLLLCAPGDRRIVVGRQEELDRLPDETLERAECFVVSELAGLPDDEASNGLEILSGLHAKVYAVEQGAEARLFIGSANATNAAFGGNVEVLVELVGKRADLGIDAMVGPKADLREVLEPYERGEPVEFDDDAELLIDLVRDIAEVPLVATVQADAERYTIHLTSEDALPTAEGVRLTAELHTRRAEAATLVAGQPVRATFTGLALTDITPFVIITAEQRGVRERTIVLATLMGDPADRLDHVLAEQIDTFEKFQRFLLLMLGLGAEAAAVPPVEGEGGGSANWRAEYNGIFELLLNALAEHPERLDDLANLIARIEARGAKLWPDEFSKLWALVEQARQDELEVARA